MNRKTRTVNLRLPGILFRAAIVPAACLVITGCAHNTFTVSSLPNQYAARPVSDYSGLDLAAYAQPAPSEDEIRVGDRLALALNSGIGGDDAIEKWTVGVDEEGNATIPNVGPIRLAGLTQSEAQQSIAQESINRNVYLTPAVDLRFEERHENSIVVTGSVVHPGELRFPEQTLSLADVLVRAGGLRPEASGKITINSAESLWDSGDQLTPLSESASSGDAITVNLATTSAAELSATQVPPGATVGVESVGNRTIHVIGVINDRVVEIPAGRNVRLLDALAMAGGPTYSHWISNRIDIIRRVPNKNETIRIRASIRKAKKNDQDNLLLSPGDIVSVEENPLTFTMSTLGGLAGLANTGRVVGAVP